MNLKSLTFLVHYLFLLSSASILLPIVSFGQREYYIFPFAQSEYNDLHPDFSSSENGSGWASDKLWLAYDSEIDSGNTEVFVRSRFRGADIWSEPIQLTTNDALDQFPTVDMYNQQPLVVWETNLNGHFDLMYIFYDGSGWTEPYFITQDTVDDRHPKIQSYRIWHSETQSYSFNMMLVWERSNRLYWNQYDDAGWQSPQPLTIDSKIQQHPFLAGDESKIWLVWQSDQNGNWDIFGTRFDKERNYWSIPQQLTFVDSSDINPTIIKSWWPQALCYVIWQTNRDGNEELYLKKWWQDSDSTYLTEPINLTMNESNDVQPHGLWIPGG